VQMHHTLDSTVMTVSGRIDGYFGA
jgi:hypothetical protein